MSAAFDEALRLHQSGRSAEAEPIYRRIIATEPEHADALHLLGVVHLQRGDVLGAAGFIRRALASAPNYGEAYNNLGIALQAEGRFAPAEQCFLRAFALQPDNAESCNNLGVVRMRQGRPEYALDCYRRARELAPGFAQACNNEGKALEALGRAVEAVEAYRRAVALDPEHAEAWNNFGNMLQHVGQYEEAIGSYLQALARAPHYVTVYSNLGAALQLLGRLGESMAAHLRGLAMDPAQIAGHINLANVRHIAGDALGAEASSRLALALNPGAAEAHNNLGNALRDQGQLEQAMASYRAAIRFKPELAEAHNNLGAVQTALGIHDEAVANFRAALRHKPDYVSAHANLIQTLLYDSSVTSAALGAELRRHAQAHTPPEIRRRFANTPNPDRRLRIGYVSSNFRSHAVAVNLEPLFRTHDAAEFEIACYAQVPRPDAATEVFRQRAQIWRSIVGMSDESAADMIRADGVDILIAVAGWFDGNRPLICAHRPAPVQATLFDGASSGLPAIDYWLTDRFLHPPDTADPATERLERVDHLIVYPPPIELSSPGPPPSIAAGHVTFGSCNNPAKLTSETIALWSRVLAAVPGSRLVLKYLNWFANDDLCRRLIERFAVHGIPADRIAFEAGARARADHFRRIDGFDVALDTFPFTGCTTTFEALSMGVPVVTLVGERYASRMSGSLLSGLGLRDLIAGTADDYVATAVTMAADEARRGELRTTLRRRIVDSPLCDAVAYGRAMGAAYRRMWRRWCGQQDTGRLDH